MSANATTKNEQAGKQREKIIERNTLSGSSTLLGIQSLQQGFNRLFEDFDADGILENAKVEFKINEAVKLGENPDFADKDVDLTYKDPSELYTDVASQDDMPNMKGPQLKTIKISQSGAPDITNSNLEQNVLSGLPENRGFGVTEEPQDFPGRYNSRENVTLGDYITSAEE